MLKHIWYIFSDGWSTTCGSVYGHNIQAHDLYLLITALADSSIKCLIWNFTHVNLRNALFLCNVEKEMPSAFYSI